MGFILDSRFTCSRFNTVGNMFSGFLSVHLAALAADLKSRSSFSVLTDQLHTSSCC